MSLTDLGCLLQNIDTYFDEDLDIEIFDCEDPESCGCGTLVVTQRSDYGTDPEISIPLGAISITVMRRVWQLLRTLGVPEESIAAAAEAVDNELRKRANVKQEDL